jgi:Pectinacetylesterase
MRQGAAVAVALLGIVTGCSAESTAAPQSSAAVQSSAVVTAPPTTEPAPTATEPPTTTTPPVAGWKQVTAPSECMCSDGSPYSYWVHQGSTDKVVFFLQGGGACFDVASCGPTSDAFKRTTGSDDDPTKNTTGIFDFSDRRNPFADYSFVFAPYCTGDVHIGHAMHDYGNGIVVQHKGSVNASAALATLAKEFPDAKELVVTGESAGSVPTPLYAGLAHDLLPKAGITVLADGSGAYPDIPAINGVIGAAWGTEAAIPPWPENAGQTAVTWSLPGLFVQAHKHAPEIVFGRHDYAFDRTQEFFAALAGIPAENLVTLIDNNETQIEAGGLDLRSYIAPGDSHTVLGKPDFYTETVEGVPFVDWAADLIRRTPQPDVHCSVCK